MEFELEISESFQKDMDEVLAYISLNLYNPEAASRLLKKAETIVENIQCNPYMYSYSHIEAIASRGYRSAAVGNYEIFYKVDSEAGKIYVYRFLYGSMDLQEIML